MFERYFSVRQLVALGACFMLAACAERGPEPQQLYKAYELSNLQELELVDRAGMERMAPEFEYDYSRLPDFSAIEETSTRKQAFFDYLRPAIEHQNAVNRERRLLLGAISLKLEYDLPLDYPQTLFMERMRERYRIPEELSDAEAAPLLERRLDVIPTSLALAQAALESGWGTSRFARNGNNLFGQWCFDEGCGVVPGRRNTGARHEVRSFDSIDEAVSAYFRNINTHPVYAPARDIREKARANGDNLTGLEMAAGLGRYSERGEAYIKEVRQMIRVNELETGDD